MSEEFQGHSKCMLELSLEPTLLGCRRLSLSLCYPSSHNQVPLLSLGRFPTEAKGPRHDGKGRNFAEHANTLFLAFQVLEVPWVTF